MTDDFYSSKDLARRWGITERTLERWRRQKQGPAYVKLGWLVFYRKTAVAEFELHNTHAPETAAGSDPR